MRGRYQILILSAVLMLVSGVSSAQSLGDIARAERARRAGLEKHATVLTNEDLQREQIVVRAPLTSATLNATTTPTENAPATTSVQPTSAAAEEFLSAAPVSLGEVARRYRAQRDARRRAEAEALAARAPQAVAPVLPRVNAITVVEQKSPAAPKENRKQTAPLVAIVPAREKSERRSVIRAERKTQSAKIVAAGSADSVIVVHRGDSLWKISRHELGDGVLWTAIWKANPQIKNPNRIYPGQKLEQPSEEQVAAARGHRHSGIELVAAKQGPAQKRMSAIVVRVEQSSIRNASATHTSAIVARSSRVRCGSSENFEPAEECKTDSSVAALVRGRR